MSRRSKEKNGQNDYEWDQKQKPKKVWSNVALTSEWRLLMHFNVEAKVQYDVSHLLN